MPAPNVGAKDVSHKRINLKKACEGIGKRTCIISYIIQSGKAALQCSMAEVSEGSMAEVSEGFPPILAYYLGGGFSTIPPTLSSLLGGT